MHVRIRSTTDGESLDYEIVGTGTCRRADTENPGEEHTLMVEGGSSDDPTTYELRVTGSASRGEHANPEEDAAAGPHITGQVAGGVDSYTFTGTVLDFSTDGSLTVSIDGATVDESALGVDVGGVTHIGDEWEARGSTDGEHVYEVLEGEVTDFVQTGGDSDWVLEFDDEPVAFGGPDAEPGSGFGYVTPQQVRSFVECYLDDYLTHEQVDNVVESKLADLRKELEGGTDDSTDGSDGTDDGSSDDGTTDDGSGDLPEHHIVIEGGSQETHVSYTFTVTGKVDAGRRANEDDRIYADMVKGEVRGGGDDYHYTGDITGFEVSHPDLVTVKIDGETVNPADLG